MKKRRFTGKNLRWIFGILFLVGGAAGITTDNWVGGILCALFGISLLPAVWNILFRNIKCPKWTQIAVPILLFMMTAVTLPSTEAQSTGSGDAPARIMSSDTLLNESDNAETKPEKKEEASVAEQSDTSAVTPVPTIEVITTPAPVSENGEMAVHFLDVGQGLSILVQSGGQNLIYDGGDKETSSFVVSYLKSQGVETIDYLISSHYDSDHLSGLIGCLNAFEVENVISSDYEHDSKTYESFVSAAAKKGLSLQHPAAGTEIAFGTGTFTILAPVSIDSDDSNNNSVAIRLTNGRNSFIFTGDAEHASEAAMCGSGLDLSCDVLVPGHHGSATATSWEFLQASVPEYAVISCGSDNQYGHPDKDTMDKLKDMEIQVYRTDRQGTVVAVSDGTAISWNQPPCNDYTSGDSSDIGTQPGMPGDVPGSDEAAAPAPSETSEAEPEVRTEEQVWVSATGKKYHNKPDCGNMNPDKARQMSRSEAETAGLGPCSKCF